MRYYDWLRAYSSLLTHHFGLLGNISSCQIADTNFSSVRNGLCSRTDKSNTRGQRNYVNTNKIIHSSFQSQQIDHLTFRVLAFGYGGVVSSPQGQVHAVFRKYFQVGFFHEGHSAQHSYINYCFEGSSVKLSYELSRSSKSEWLIPPAVKTPYDLHEFPRQISTYLALQRLSIVGVLCNHYSVRGEKARCRNEKFWT